ncbi:MAG: cytochrome c [Gemmatimonadetes bacterium]|nr:cytochrome c [Gemmatimonadota bacterium]
MRAGIRSAALVFLGSGVSVGRGSAQAAADSVSAAVTPAAIAAGKTLYLGEGLCLACHGADAKGSIGPDLTDNIWLDGTGSFGEIVARVLAGVSSEQSKLGQIMPPRGGSGITDEQVRAVAAYVWSLSHKPARK